MPNGRGLTVVGDCRTISTGNYILLADVRASRACDIDVDFEVNPVRPQATSPATTGGDAPRGLTRLGQPPGRIGLLGQSHVRVRSGGVRF